MKIGIILFFVAITCFVLAQTPPSLLWNEFYGGDSSDGFNNIIKTTDNLLLMGGYKKSSQYGDYDIFTVKTNTDGEIEWELYIEGLLHNEVKKVIETSDGSYLLLVENDNWGSEPNYTSIVKVNSQGNVIWTQHYYDFADPIDITKTNNNEYVIIGHQLCISEYPHWILRINDAGEIIWINNNPWYHQNNSNIKYFKSISGIIGEDSYIISGENYNDQISEAFLLKINSWGDIQWFYTYSINQNNYTSGNILQDTDGFKYWVFTQNDNFIVTINSNGEYVNSIEFQYPCPLNLKVEFLNYNENFIFLGRNFESNFVLFQINPSGELDWYSEYDIAFYEEPTSFEIFDTNIYITGISNNDPLYYSSDCFLSKLEFNENPVNNQIIKTTDIYNLENSPNPFNPYTTISFFIPIDSDIEISIYNIKGQKLSTIIKSHLEPGHHSLSWFGRDSKNNVLNSGIYFCQLKVNGVAKSMAKMQLVK